MKAEQKIVEYLYHARYDDLKPDALRTVKNQLLTVLGTTIAGSAAEGCRTIAELCRELDGKEEATILIHGGKVPAQSAAFVNGVMARALDFCDAMARGAHMGSAVVPGALAATELAGGCSGRDFLAAMAASVEVGTRLNLTESQYDGFDPTGVCVIFAATAAAAKILRLNEEQMWHALALAFNRCGGSFQSNVDGSLAVRVIEGWVAEAAITCTRLASRNITGPKNFLEGIYGYFHLYGRDRMDAQSVVGGLGTESRLREVVFKKYPSCGLTQSCTEIILSLMKEHGIRPEAIDRIEVRVPPYTYKLVGHPFQVGNNPKVNAQFSIRYCVASALMSGAAKLRHFEEASIRDPDVMKFTEKVSVISDPEMEKRDHTSTDMRVLMLDGREYVRMMEIAPGAPGNPLSQEEHEERFWDCIRFAERPFPDEKAKQILDAVDRLETINDVRSLIPLLVPSAGE